MTKNSEAFLWCKQQGNDEDGIFCTAHLAENRIFNCPYANAEERLKAEFPCSDYKEMAEVVSPIY